MKKILFASFVVFCLVATGTAVAWDIDIWVDVDDAKVDLTANTGIVDDEFPDGDYAFWVGAGVDGNGVIDIEKANKRTRLETWVDSYDSETTIYANQATGVDGCCVECEEGPCCEAPSYFWGATSGVTHTGDGEIYLEQQVHGPNKDHHKNNLWTTGTGDFTAGMATYDSFEDMLLLEPTHAFGASGTNVNFMADGVVKMDGEDCMQSGDFYAQMCFYEEGCPCDPCPCGDDDDDDDCGPCPC